jgi:peptide/nickel transport system permease protein
MEESEDKREFIVHLRKGVRWSDGEPVTADDIMFWWRHEENNKSVGTGVPSRWIVAAGGRTVVEKLDGHTVRFRFEHPYGHFREALASYSPDMLRYAAHYWRRYHPDLADKTFLKGEMQALGISNARALYNNRLKRWDNPEAPRLWPWVLEKSVSGQSYTFVRNPYYFAVDPRGNQLPYIDRLHFTIKSPQMMNLAFYAGEVGMQGRHVRYQDYTELMSQQVARSGLSGFKLYHWYPASRSTWLLHPNLTRRKDPSDPETLGKALLLADKRFRQALSLAINRPAAIKAEFNGQAKPSQVDPGPQSYFHHERLAKAFVDFDPARASAMLDELGLTQRDVDGMRTLPDGGTLTLHLNFSAFTGLGPGQFVIEDWARIGIRAVAREMQRALFYTKRDSADFDFMVWSSESDMFPLLQPTLFAPLDTESLFAVNWGRWFSRGGYYNSDAVKGLPNAQGPAEGHPMLQAYQALIGAQQASTPEDQVQIFRQALDVAAENLWTINIAEAPPYLVVVSNDLRNVPRNALYSAVTKTPANTGLETYYFEHPESVHDQDSKRRSANPPALPRDQGGAVSEQPEAMNEAATPLLCLISIGAALLLVGRVYPYIARRLLIAIPTLLVTSMLVFSIMKLPPGDFVTSRMAMLSESGEASALNEAESLKRTFHLDDPGWKQYMRWAGLLWFVSFEPDDRGLLQGHMGLSMEHATPVNQLIGDRLWMTLGISTVSLMLSWMLAIPLGIYSAVRSNSVADRICTALCFVSMSVPPFMLALVLVACIGTAGLSPTGSALPSEACLANLWHLAKELWIPIVVSAVPGAAVLIRVMRANLLDELRKPYVTAARAKGLRPLRLILRYPVRLALNPVVSGIGQLVPTLVSGGAIVGIVLSLPTIGPLMLSALLNEDQYLAGSLLMVLSVATIVGTLLADIALLWLDPRIRHEVRQS